MSEAVAEPEQRVSWLELFFDLVVVVAVAQLAGRLEEHATPLGIGLFAVLYGAVWMSWMSFTVYANVSKGAVRTRACLYAMAAMAVMAAAVPEVTGHRPEIFAAMYVVVRLIAQRVFSRTHKVVAAWSSAQIPYGIAPWIVSFWVDDPAWRYGLWAFGLLIEFTLSVLRSDDPDQLLAQVRLRKEHQNRRRQRARTRPFELPTLATLNIGHLGERLGLFVIIVLGEAVAQLIGAAAHTAWTVPRGAAALAGFGLLVGLWSLIFRYGFTAVPQFGVGALPPRLAMPIHFFTTGAITAVAAGLGAAVHEAGEHLPTALRWVLCAGTGVYFLATAVGAASMRAPWHWLLGWALPGVLVPSAVGALGGALPAWSVAALMTAVVLWQVYYVPLRAWWTAWRGLRTAA